MSESYVVIADFYEAGNHYTAGDVWTHEALVKAGFTPHSFERQLGSGLLPEDEVNPPEEPEGD